MRTGSYPGMPGRSLTCTPFDGGWNCREWSAPSSGGLWDTFSTCARPSEAPRTSCRAGSRPDLARSAAARPRLSDPIQRGIRVLADATGAKARWAKSWLRNQLFVLTFCCKIMSRRRTIYVALGLLTSLGAHALAGPVVLCTGTGGHLALEPVRSGCCRSTPSQDACHTASIQGTGLGECGGCRDVPISLSPAHDRGREVILRLQIPQPTAFVDALLGKDLPGLSPAQVSWGTSHLPLRGSLVHLRTTILLL